MGQNHDNAVADLALPTAVIERKRVSGWWLIAVFALCLSIGLFWQTQTGQPVKIEILFQHGHGIKPGDALRYRGIRVGEVQQVRLTTDLHRVRLTLGLLPEAAQLARTGSRFWIVRAQFDLGGVAGLETLVGANYLSVLPGHGPPQSEFIGLEEVPIIDTLEPGGLELVLQSDRAQGLHLGAPVSFRSVIIGRLVAIELASDASAVEVSVYIRPRYAHLVRRDSRFWQTAGVNIAGGLGGFSIDLDSVQSLLSGGINLATPNTESTVAASGDRFKLHLRPEKAWLSWVPALLPGTGPAAFAEPPIPATIRTRWEERRYLFSRVQREQAGLVWPLDVGIAGPEHLLIGPDSAVAETVQWGFATDSAESVTLWSAPRIIWREEGLAILDFAHPQALAIVQRRSDVPVDIRLYARDGTTTTFISAARLTADENRWIIAPTVALPGDFHGALALAAHDHALLGLVSQPKKEEAVVVLGPFPGEQN